jgi:hypothetical protein
MSKNRSAAGITNIVQYDANKNITFVSGSATLLTVSSSGALTTTSTITAQTLVVQTITSSVNFVTGSTKFGVIVGNTHQFTGSVNVTGSLSVVTTGTEFQVTNTGVRIGNVSTDVHPITGSVNVSGSATFSGSLLANGIMSLGDDGTYGSTYKTLGLTGNANGSHRILAGTADDLYIAAATSRGITFLTNGTNTARMTILPSGSVGIGTSYDRLLLNIGGNIALINSDTYSTSLTRSITYYSSTINYSLQPIANINFLTQGDAVSAMTFTTRSSPADYAERMRITSVGNVLVGTTTDIGYRLYVQGSGGQGAGWMQQDAAPALYVNRTTNDGGLIVFLKAGVQVGIISTNTYTLPSDLNFKKNIDNLELGLNLITKLRPVSYNHKIDDADAALSTGFIAQELEQSLTELGVEQNKYHLLQHVPNEKEGESQYWLDYQKIIPVLTKAIQELKAEIDALKAQ